MFEDQQILFRYMGHRLFTTNSIRETQMAGLVRDPKGEKMFTNSRCLMIKDVRQV